jgi:hypothetical protein
MVVNKVKTFFLVLTLAASLGCLHKSNNAAVTPWERITTDNAVFSQLLNNATDDTIAVQGTNLITAAQAAPVLSWERVAAQDHEQITAILAQGPAANLSTLAPLLQQIQSSGTSLVNSGGLGIKNPATQRAIDADINALVSLAGTILADVSALKGATP